MKLLGSLQGYKSFIVNIVAALVNIAVFFNIEVSAEDQEMIVRHLTTLAAAGFAMQALIATIMRLVTKTPPGKDVGDVRESVVHAVQTQTDDILGDPDEI